MNILIPYVGKGLDELIDAGADELYFGFYDSEWTGRFGEYTNLNRMSDFGERSNPMSFHEALETIKRIRDKGKKAFITFNANVYSQEGLDFIGYKYFPSLKEADVSGVIVSTLNLTREACDMGLNPVGSTMCSIYNMDILRVFHDAGMSRFILPRDLTLGEVQEIIENFPEDEFEVFLMRNGCVFSDSYCLGMHRKECRGATCSYLRHEYKTFITSPKSFEERQSIDLNDMLYNEYLHEQTCGLCAIYRLMQMGVSALKVVGRSDYWGSILRDIRLVKEDIEIAEQSSSEEEYLERMRFPRDASRHCLSGLNCYYPEVRFG